MTTLDGVHVQPDTQVGSDTVDLLATAQVGVDVLTTSGGGDLLGLGHSRHAAHSPTAQSDTPAGDQGRSDTQTRGAASNFSGVQAALAALSDLSTPGPGGFDELRIFAESFEDAQKARIAIENRLRAGGTIPDAAQEALDSLHHAEKKLGLAMRRCFRRVAPEVSAWVKSDAGVGVGEHLMARLLGVIGDPVIAYPHHWEQRGEDRRVLIADEPFVRNVAKLWAYCGHGDATRKRAKGMSQSEALAMGNPRAKMIVHLLAEGAMKCVGSAEVDPIPNGLSPTDAPLSDDAIDAPIPKQRARRRSPYRDTYDLARAAVLDREEWAPAHQHAHALRLTGKEILRDLWVVRMEALA